MLKVDKEEELMKVNHLNDYMANERTFLAWIRTSIGIMAFGFVVEKFALFLKQLSFLLGKSNFTGKIHPVYEPPEYSSIFGIVLVAVGALIGFLAFIKFKKAEKQIREGWYQPSFVLELMLTLFILAIGVFLIIYLIQSI